MANHMQEQLYNGFQTQKQLTMYLEFTGRALELMQQEIMNKLLGSSVVNIDQDTW